MATTTTPDALDPTPYTPAGDLEAVLSDLEAVLDEPAGDDDAGDDAVLPALDDALDALADSVADAEREPNADATVDAGASGDGADASGDDASADVGWDLQPARAEFDEIAAETDVDSVPFDDAATFLASDLYAVPPANTRFVWQDEDALADD